MHVYKLATYCTFTNTFYVTNLLETKQNSDPADINLI